MAALFDVVAHTQQLVERRWKVGMMFYDLSKAVDTVNIEILLEKMCRVSARRLSIYNFAWELLKATNLQAESKILKYWNIKSTNQNEKFSKKSMYLKSVKEPNIRMEATRRNLRARLKILKKISDCQINQSKRKFSQKKYV
jgi:hypothetical protein